MTKKIYLVGGAVRDELLGTPVNDRDWVAVGYTPDEFLKKGFSQVGKDFPVFLHPETKEEFALARKERKIGVGYSGFSTDFDTSITLEEDLIRRDLTINAIAKDLDGTYYDPYGGINDLKNKVLRHVSENFKEDPLRVLRIARFMARYNKLGFVIAEETLNLMKEMSSNGELSHLTPERVNLEITKTFKEPDPEKFFEILREVGALKVILPELDNLYGVEQREEYHPEIDTFVHTMMVLKKAKELSNSNPSIMYAALFHDLGKGITPKDLLPRHIMHEKNGIPLVENVCDRLKLDSKTKKLSLLVCEHHINGHNIMEMSDSRLVSFIEKELDVSKTNSTLLEDFAISCKSDAQGRLNFENCEYPQLEFLLKLKEFYIINFKKINNLNAINNFKEKKEKGFFANKSINEYMADFSYNQKLNIVKKFLKLNTEKSIISTYEKNIDFLNISKGNFFCNFNKIRNIHNSFFLGDKENHKIFNQNFFDFLDKKELSYDESIKNILKENNEKIEDFTDKICKELNISVDELMKNSLSKKISKKFKV